MLVVLQQGYLGLILALLTTPTHEPHIDSLGDLVEAIQTRGFKWMTYENSYIYGCTFNNYRCIPSDQFSQLKKVSITDKTVIIQRELHVTDNDQEYYDERREVWKWTRSQSIVQVVSEREAKATANKYRDLYYVSNSLYGLTMTARVYRIGSHLVKPVSKL